MRIEGRRDRPPVDCGVFTLAARDNADGGRGETSSKGDWERRVGAPTEESSSLVGEYRPPPPTPSAAPRARVGLIDSRRGQKFEREPFCLSVGGPRGAPLGPRGADGEEEARTAGGRRGGSSGPPDWISTAPIRRHHRRPIVPDGLVRATIVRSEDAAEGWQMCERASATPVEYWPC
uniref:Uncharacterized protein n=1 Tax=Steinernema glaseri TaxID=37863 RepID=A0A1I7ZER7_9BILA